MSILFDPMTADFKKDVKVFGERYNERYHMPLLPGEVGVKSGGDWVPGGIRSATNLAGAIVDSRALQTWLVQRTQMGLTIAPELFTELCLAVDIARMNGADLSELKASEAGVTLRGELARIDDAARTAVGANRAASMGTSMHLAWEVRGKTGELIGPPSVREQILALEALLDSEGLERVPGLSERVVRNTRLEASGRFDDILLSRKTGRLYMADLKTKRKTFFTWLEVWIQLAVYATADFMLDEAKRYAPGPASLVDQECAILLRLPSDGSTPPYLEPVDLRAGLRWAELARDVCAARSEAASVRTVAAATWR